MKETITPRDLFFDQLSDLLSVESQLLRAMPELIALTTHPALKTALEEHAQETERQHRTLESIFVRVGTEIGQDEGKAMVGLIEGGHGHLRGVNEPRTRDLMMIAHCLRVEHYEIAAYEITVTLAERLGYGEEAETLNGILTQERAVASLLKDLEPEIFQRAMEP